MTDSNAKLKRDIAAGEKRLAAVLAKNGECWTAHRLRESLSWQKSQLALPRNKRCCYTEGSSDLQLD